MKRLMILLSTVLALFSCSPMDSDNKDKFLEDNDAWVDLGLSVLWAKYNIGATSPEEYGGYYAWGEKEEKITYTAENYSFKKIDDETFSISGTSNDVARAKWGGGSRMPDYEEIEELRSLCQWEDHVMNGVNGSLVTGQNGNTIFIPDAGLKYGADRMPFVIFWSATSYRAANALSLPVVTPDGTRSYWERAYGLPVRAVKDK